MHLDFDLDGDIDSAEHDANDLTTARATYEQYLSAGILFPEEIRNAERMLRYFNKIAGASVRLRPATETVPA
ncbi:MAG: hypothetical protein WB853_16015 [Desulfobacterales bacterium]